MKRIPIAELEGASLHAAMRYLLGEDEAERYRGKHDGQKKYRLLWSHQSGVVDVPDGLVEKE